MAVQSKDMHNGIVDDTPQTTPRAATHWTTRVLLGVVLIVLGLLQWLPAARFTVDGWFVWINAILRWLQFTERLSLLTGVWLVGTSLIIGLLYSRVEIDGLPIQRRNQQWVLLPFAAWVGWAFLSATDVGTTYTGLIAPPANAAQLWKDVAVSQTWSLMVAFYLTFAPDWFILGGLYLIVPRRWFAWLRSLTRKR